MIRIARQTDYAVRLVLHLAALGDSARVSLQEVSEHRMLPVPFVRRMVGRLVKAGILRTARGAGGGVMLARPAAEISLADVVHAMEGKLSLNHCVSHPGSCPFASGCPAQRAWTAVTQSLEQQLAEIRFDFLARGPKGHAAAHLKLKSPGPARSRTRPSR